MPIAAVCLAGGVLVFFLKIDFGSFLLSLAAIEIGIWAAVLTTVTIAIEFLSTTHPDMIRCGFGIAISVMAMGVSLLFGIPV